MKIGKINKIGTKIAILSICSTLVAVSTAVVSVTVTNQKTINQELQNISSSLMDTMSLQMEDDKKVINDMISDKYIISDIRELFEKNQTAQMKTVSDYYVKMYDIGHIAVIDTGGQVIADSYVEGYENKATSYDVIEALKGNASADYYCGNDIKISYRATFPIKDEKGNIICAVVAEYLYDYYPYIKDMHDKTGAEYTFFVGNERRNTSILKDNKPYIESKLVQNITSKVIGEGQIYQGKSIILEKSYMAEYRPIFDNDKNVIGAIFCGYSIDNAIASTQRGMIVFLTLTFAIMVIISFLMIRLIRKYLGRPIQEMSKAAVELSKGNLDVNIKYESHDDIGLLAQGLKETINNLRSYIADITFNLDAVASGDFRNVIHKDYAGSFAPIKKSIVTIINSMNNTFESIKIAADEVSAGSEQVATGAQQLSMGAVQQAHSIEQLSVSINDIAQKAKNNAESVLTASEYVQNAQNGVTESNEHMDKMLVAINAINESSSEIHKIIKVIDDIAFQTNILALNAAVEAARAGNAGKGFAVVSDEVRNLASRSADAAKQTTVLIEGALENIRKGTELAKKTAQSLQKVNDETGNVFKSITQIKAASSEQSVAVEKISDEISNISGVVQTNSSTSEESAAASNELSGQAVMLKKKVSEFKLVNDKNDLTVPQRNNNIKTDPPKSNYDFRKNSSVPDFPKTINANKSAFSAGAVKNNPPVKKQETVLNNPPKNTDQLRIDLDDDKY